MVWYEGKKNGAKNLPPDELLKGETPPGSGCLLAGAKGILYSPNDYAANYKLLPEKDFRGYQEPEPTLPRTTGNTDLYMKEEWVRAIRSGNPADALSNFDYAGLLAETVLLGNVAIRVGKKFDWDGPGLQATNCPEAAQYIKREYRNGWTL
jgi:hypothetical protein